MKTRILRVTDDRSLAEAVDAGARLLQEGEVVAFPTETVYGLGANAMDPEAVRRIFDAKGRPGYNPLIVHISDVKDLDKLTAGVPGNAYALMEAFWPGPLTLIFAKSDSVPPEVTAGLPTVAVRMPSHRVAAALIRESGLPIAAPSANRSGRPSPTKASHVYEDMNGIIPLIIDGGDSDVGVESTVLDITGGVPVVLRPGGVTVEMLREAVGEILVDPGVMSPLAKDRPVRSPGMKYTHYAPKVPVIIFRGPLDKLKEHIARLIFDYAKQGKRVGVLATDETRDCYKGAEVLSMGTRRSPSVLASRLFACLRDFDRMGVDIILAEGVEERDEGLAVMNRMARAAGFHIIDI